MKNDLAYKNATVATWIVLFGKTAPHAAKQPFSGNHIVHLAIHQVCRNIPPHCSIPL